MGPELFFLSEAETTLSNQKLFFARPNSILLTAALAGVYAKSIAPYQASGVFNLVPSMGSLLSGIQLLPAPGHTPGHNFIKVTSGVDVLIISADTWISKVSYILVLEDRRTLPFCPFGFRTMSRRISDTNSIPVPTSISACLSPKQPDQVRHPNWTFSFATHPQQAITSRRRLLHTVATKRYPVIAFHESFPGFGYITTRHRGYDWVPARMPGVGASRKR